jgi:hypothetical protein
MTRKLKPRSGQDDEASVFTTYDLGVSAALLCLGYKLIRLDRDDPRKALFVFRKEKDIDTYANQYFSDQLKVKARSFFDSIKALKNKLYSE